MDAQEKKRLLDESSAIPVEDTINPVNDFYRPNAQRDRYCSTQQTSNNVPEPSHADRSESPAFTFSVRRARFVSAVALFLYRMGSYPSSIACNQYLVHRWSVEANLSDTFKGSVCFRNDSDPRQKEEDQIQARVSDATMYFDYAVSFPAVVSSIVMGTYSDVIGRRAILLIPLAATMLKFLGCVIIVRYNLDPNYFYIGNVIEGIGGSYFVVLIASFAITADLSAKKSSRMLWINILICFNQTLSAAFAIGNGYVIDNLGFVAAFIMVLIPVSLAFSLALFFLPETRPKNESHSLNFWTNTGSLVKLYTSVGSRRRRIALSICLLLFFFGVIDILNVTSITTLFQLHLPLCWDATHIGYYAAVSQGVIPLFGILYQSGVQRYGCLSLEKIAMLGMLFQAGSFVLEAFVQNIWMMYIVAALLIPAFPVVGIIRGIMSVLAGPFNQGTLFASIAVVEALCSIASNTALYRVYSATIDTMVGAVFLLMAGFCLVNFFLFFPFFHYYDDPSKAKRRECDVQVEKESQNER